MAYACIVFTLFYLSTRMQVQYYQCAYEQLTLKMFRGSTCQPMSTFNLVTLPSGDSPNPTHPVVLTMTAKRKGVPKSSKVQFQESRYSPRRGIRICCINLQCSVHRRRQAARTGPAPHGGKKNVLRGLKGRIN